MYQCKLLMVKFLNKLLNYLQEYLGGGGYEHFLTPALSMKFLMMGGFFLQGFTNQT